jgi:protein-tyrosine phosphatase
VKTTEPPRRLAWDACLNARDLGGYPTAHGQTTAWRAVVRADSLARLTADGQTALVAYGVRTVIDLRLPDEVALAPNPFAAPGEHGVAYANLSLIDPAAGPAPAFTTLANDYLGMLHRFQHTVTEIVSTIAAAPPGGVVVHCAAGKDRTGLIAALLLDLVGVAPEIIAADYALTAEYLQPEWEAWLASGPGSRAERERDLVRTAPTIEVMLTVLATLADRHGGAAGYLQRGGLSAEQLARVRARMLGSIG